MSDPIKILLIDDNSDFLFTTETFLRRNGYRETLTAPDGIEGIELCRRESPQVIITDLRMPCMDGLEILRRIKEEDPDKEVIVVTGHGEVEAATRALQLDASDFVTKPINHEALLLAIQRAEKRHRDRKKLYDYTVLLEQRWMETADELGKMVVFRKNLIDSSMDGILGCNTRGTTIIFNRSLERMLGYSKNQVCGKVPFERFFQVGEAERFKEKLRSDEYGGLNRLLLFETNLMTKTGDKIPVQLSATVVFEGREEIGMVAFLRDLREIKRLEQQFADQARLLQQDKMISMGRLAASVAHEINSPLSGILNYARLMIKILRRRSLEQEAVEKFKGYLALMESETSRSSQVVSNLLAYSRKSGMELARINISELLQKCIMLSQHKVRLQNIQIKTQLERNLTNVRGDFNQIQQCIINLIFNAIDAMPDGGTLTLKSSLNSRDGVVEIRVQDTGKGIGDNDLPHIFEPLYTTKAEGESSGLGLPTVYNIVERHKGTILVHSEPDKGTVFTIKFPWDREGAG